MPEIRSKPRVSPNDPASSLIIAKQRKQIEFQPRAAGVSWCAGFRLGRAYCRQRLPWAEIQFAFVALSLIIAFARESPRIKKAGPHL